MFGRRNVGKSSLLNALTRQDVAIVSEIAGTTTDPVEKPMELLPIGPVLFIDTAGIDDVGELGTLRVEQDPPRDRSRRRGDPGHGRRRMGRRTRKTCWTASRKVRFPLSRSSTRPICSGHRRQYSIRLAERQVRVVQTVANRGEGMLDLREALIEAAPKELLNTPTIVGDLVPAGEMAVLVVPIDMEAPKGRLILPQVQTIRDLLDSDAYCMVVKERELRDALARLNRPPALVITDSQAFLKVAADTPRGVLLTSFSILFARHKGDLAEFVRGAMAIDRLKSGDGVLVCEACTHHPIGDDIGRVKIPRWLRQYVGGDLDFHHYQGHDFPEDLDRYSIVIHCGACVQNRREMLSRILRCRRAGVPITNYGMSIAYSLGIFERALGPFPAALAVYQEEKTALQSLAPPAHPSPSPTRQE